MTIILGIETSCDETAAAVVRDGKEILSSVVSSQIAVHKPFGGVVPELASRKHLEAIVPVVNEALQIARISPKDLNAIAVTQGPGLVGALLVGFSFAKAYAYSLKIPYIGVNHLEGHIHSVFAETNPPPYPFVALLVSGGHTAIYEVMSPTEIALMGHTMDDAAGEAFDKVSKMLGLGYPGGSIISKLAASGNPGKIPFPRIFLDKSGFDFSFSGLKTAVNRYIQSHPGYRDELDDIAASFQDAVVEVLAYKLINAAKQKQYRHIAVVGGVAANSRLRETIQADAGSCGISVCIPPMSLCGDNAAMIAAAGYHYLVQGKTSDMNADVYSKSAVTISASV
jgi:N6-L-threonylcarbamoyladenine synthase